MPEPPRDRTIDFQNSIDAANEYRDAILAVAKAKASGMGRAHPTMIAVERKLGYLKQRYPSFPDATCLKLASKRLADLEENRAELFDQGLGEVHPTVLALQRPIDALAELIDKTTNTPSEPTR